MGAAETRQLSAGMHALLRANGIVVVGWNRGSDHSPDEDPAVFMSGHFVPWDFPPRRNSSFLANPENGHTFEFFAKA